MRNATNVQSLTAMPTIEVGHWSMQCWSSLHAAWRGLHTRLRPSCRCLNEQASRFSACSQTWRKRCGPHVEAELLQRMENIIRTHTAHAMQNHLPSRKKSSCCMSCLFCCFVSPNTVAPIVPHRKHSELSKKSGSPVQVRDAAECRQLHEVT